MKPLVIVAVLVSIGSTLPLSATLAMSQPPAVAVTQVQTATFAVENMTCALCPVTVKAAMGRVDGVRSVKIDFDAKTATVVFNPALASAEAIAAASTNAGYPAKMAP